MSSKLSRFRKFGIAPQLYCFLLFVIHGNKFPYFVHALQQLDYVLLGKVLLAMCSPLVIAVNDSPLPVQKAT